MKKTQETQYHPEGLAVSFQKKIRNLQEMPFANGVILQIPIFVIGMILRAKRYCKKAVHND
ncbi:MAG: hypothetical protein ABIL39_11905 [candidate division WOR-3 bacterium]